MQKVPSLIQRGGTNPFMFASGRASSVKNLQKQTCGVVCVGYFLWIRAAKSSWLFNWLILCYISAINPPVHHSYNQQHFSISTFQQLLSFPQLARWFLIECQQSCAPPDAAGQQRRQRHHHQLGGFGLRADYWGEGYYCFFSYWHWDSTLCAFLIRPQWRLSSAADWTLSRRAALFSLIIADVTLEHFHFWLQKKYERISLPAVGLFTFSSGECHASSFRCFAFAFTNKFD